MNDKQNTGEWNTGHWNTGDYNTGCWNTGHWNIGNCNTGEWNTGSYNTGFSNAGHYNTGKHNTGNRNTGNRNTGDCNIGYYNTGNRNIGDCNTGYYNTGNRHTGWFNTISPSEILIFNKLCKIDRWNNRDKPQWLYFQLNLDLPIWTPLSELSEEQKLKYPSSEKLGGYLIGGVKVEKSQEQQIKEFKESAQKSWNEATEEDRELTFKLPNFDADIFYEIFGIDVRKKEVEKDLTIECITVTGKNI